MIIVVAYPDRGAGNDPIFFFFFFLWGVGGLSKDQYKGSIFLQWAIWE